jgi:UDP-3-O-[3-hydroxymyristoyl] N-acetylglucosamine deacetylase
MSTVDEVYDIMHQQTTKYPVSLTGISLRNGDLCTIKLSPNEEPDGIRFFTVTNGKVEIIACDTTSVRDTMCSTNIGIDDISISTVEHLMSVLHILGIDNLDITVNGSGIPILDGSAISLYYLVKSAGVKQLPHKRQYIRVSEQIEIKTDTSRIYVEPYDGFEVDMHIIYDHPLIGEQRYKYNKEVDYINEIAPARTFARIEDIKKLQELGVINGGSKDNAIILDDEKVINTELYWPDEFVRHKVLDFIGDIYMSGPIKGKFECCCTGHNTNIKFLNMIKGQLGL